MARAAIIAYIRCPLHVSHTRVVTGKGDRSIPPAIPHRDGALALCRDSILKKLLPRPLFPRHRGWMRFPCLSSTFTPQNLMPSGEKTSSLSSPCSFPDSSFKVYLQQGERGEPAANSGHARSITAPCRAAGEPLPSHPGRSRGTHRSPRGHLRAQKKILLDLVGTARLSGKEQQRQYRISKYVADQRQEIKWPLRCLPRQSRCFIKHLQCVQE